MFPALLGVGVIPVALYPMPVTVALWALLVCVIALVDRALAPRPELLEVNRSLPSSTRANQPAECIVQVHNPSPRPYRIEISDGWPPSGNQLSNTRALAVAPGGAGTRKTRLTPSRRGDLHAGPVSVRSWGPLRIAARQFAFEHRDTLRVLPEFKSRTHLPYKLARLRELDGQASVHVRGQGTEFDSLREYALGDDVRSIDWRATARASKTMIRTWRPERDRHVVIVLDTSRWSAGRIGLATRLDAGIETCLLLGALGAASGDRMSLICADSALRSQRISVSGMASVVAGFADALSQVEPKLVEAHWPLITGQIDLAAKNRALVVLVTGLDPALYEDGMGSVLPLLAARHQVVVASVSEPKPKLDGAVGAAYDLAAAERLSLARGELAASVKRMGAEVVEADSEHLAPAVCDTYLALKASGRL
jgi:uncharacterized protein (DUF58 family)